MHRNARSDTIGWHQNCEVIAGAWEPDDFVAEHAGPEGDCTVNIVGTQNDRPKA